jgi:hypothetical protein
MDTIIMRIYGVSLGDCTIAGSDQKKMYIS